MNTYVAIFYVRTFPEKVVENFTVTLFLFCKNKSIIELLSNEIFVLKSL